MKNRFAICWVAIAVRAFETCAPPPCIPVLGDTLEERHNFLHGSGSVTPICLQIGKFAKTFTDYRKKLSLGISDRVSRFVLIPLNLAPSSGQS
jgi:hypothetical protein